MNNPTVMKKTVTTVLIAFVIAFGALVVPTSVHAVGVNMRTFNILLPNGVKLNVIDNGNHVAQFVVHHDSVEFTMPDLSSVTLQSADGYFLKNDLDAFVACRQDYSETTLTVHRPGEVRIVTVTPTNPRCSLQAGGVANWILGNAGFGGGGGAVGGGNSTPDSGSGGVSGASISLGVSVPTPSGALALVVPPATTTHATTTLPIYVRVSPKFRRQLALGAMGEDVKRLQTILNADPDTRIATTGPGSIGHETSQFLYRTYLELARYQQKWGLATLGVLDATTRTHIPTIFVQATSSIVRVPPRSYGPTVPIINPIILRIWR